MFFFKFFIVCHLLNYTTCGFLLRSPTSVLQVLSRGIPLSSHDSEFLIPVLALFCSLLSYVLQTLHDSEFYKDNINDG